MAQSEGGQAVSDTPRTDQIEKLAYWFQDDMTPVCESRFVRSLELELNAANEMFRKLNIHTLNLTDRIKRLKEAGDAIINANNDDEEYEAIKHWNKSKEAKP
jgi:hypothetical protein